MTPPTEVLEAALAEEYAYDFKTADETYIKADRIRRWMPFPDSQYLFPNPAPDAQRVGWLRAADEEMVCAHLGVAEAEDSYETAKKKLASLIQWNIAVAMDPSVGGRPAPDALRVASLWWNAEDWEQTFYSLEDAYDAATGGEMRGVAKLGRATEHDPVWALRIDLDTTGDGETDDYEIRLFKSVGEAHAYLAALQAEQKGGA